MSSRSDDALIDEFLARSQELNGRIIHEREQWNSVASADAIRHFAYGISDDNPLWVDPEYAGNSWYGRLQAPPAFLTSVLYPGLHGAPMTVPLSSLISELSYEWFRPILEGDTLRSTAKQLNVGESTNRQGRRLIYIFAEVSYNNQKGEVVGKSNCTMVRVHQTGDDLLLEREVYRYSEAELDEIKSIFRREGRTGEETLREDALKAGYELPVFVRGPMTIGDLVAWQAAIGPSYRSGALAFRDCEAAPHTTAINPITGWPYKYSQQHEDGLVSKERGMPAPFDNTVMRFAWLSTMLTNWVGDSGSLRKLRMSAVEPIIYGDTNWYRGEVTASRDSGSERLVSVHIKGVNQLGNETTIGHAEVSVPSGPRYRPRKYETGHAITTETYTPFLDALKAHVKCRPDKPAVVQGSASLSYRELYDKACLIAESLRNIGIGRGSRVGVCAARRLDTLPGILGVILARAVYVPLDSEYPPSVLATMIHEAQVNLILSHFDLRQRLPADIPVMLLDREGESVSVRKPTDGITPDIDHAYIMFTSGATGTPKAVGVPYDSLDVYLDAIAGGLDISDQDAYLHSVSFCFSASIRQLFLPLYCGCTIVLADDEQRRNQLSLLSMIRSQGVTVWDTVPTSLSLCTDLLRDMAEAERNTLLQNQLRLVLTTGEALPWNLPLTWMQEFGHPAAFVNLYSQTETAGTVCLYRVPNEPFEHTENVHLGGPVKNTRVYLLDDALQPVPKGQTGEICIGGARLSSGYLNDPGLSAEKFMFDPFDPDPNARLYRSGDLAKEGTDGILRTEGRTDTRIKLSGYRVELTEIEKIIDNHEVVAKSVVAVREDRPGTRRLVGYIVPEKDVQFDAMELRQFLKRHLPVEKIPVAFQTLSELPLTASGKLRRDLLPAPDLADQGAASNDQESVEEIVLTAFSESLAVDDMDLDDNFFERGGNSLLAVEILARVFEKLQLDLPFHTLLFSPTPRMFADHIANRTPTGAGGFEDDSVRFGDSDASVQLLKLEPSNSTRNLFCIYGVFLYRDLASYLTEDASVYGIYIKSEVEQLKNKGATVSFPSVPELASQYIEQIRSVQERGPYHLIGASFGGAVAFEIAQQLTENGDTVRTLGLLDTMAPGGTRWSMKKYLTYHAGMVRGRGISHVKNRLRKRLPTGPEQSRSVLTEGDEIRRMMRNSIRSTFAPKEQFPGKVILFRAKDEQRFPVFEVDPKFGWARFAKGDVELVEIPGDHLGILEKPQVALVADRLREQLISQTG